MPATSAYRAGGGVVFVIGAGRSGTTLVHKLLAMHAAVGFVSNFVGRWPGLVWLSTLNRVPAAWPVLKRWSWFDAEGAAYLDRPRALLRTIVPTPTEGEGIYRHCGIPLTPAPGQAPDPTACERLARTLEGIRRRSGATVVVAKRTANNRRIAWLKQALPEARYIHLVRDGRSVAHSLLGVGWWSDHTLFWAGRTPRQMVGAGADELALAAENWKQELALIEEGLRLLHPQRVLQMRFEDLLAAPTRETERAFDFLGIRTDSDPCYRKGVESLGLRPQSEAWRKKWSAEQIAIVNDLQGSVLQRWGYRL
ncbi:MAG: sulfotransferase [Burkholderiales bacterium]|nr:sulfotransferase [Burkholderiales bacterium]